MLVLRIALAATCVFSLMIPLKAEAGVNCQSDNKIWGECQVDAEEDASAAPPTGAVLPPSDAGAPAPPPKCYRVKGSRTEVPCVNARGEWHEGYQCYMKKLEPQPPLTDSVWEGHTDGAIYGCAADDWGEPVKFWFGAPPVTAVQVDPAVVARKAFSQMNLHAGEIGIVPKPGGTGVIGMPQWMWIADPGPQTTGPQTISATAGNVTVTLTAKLHTVDWNMGDGNHVTCQGPGTPYDDSYRDHMSPTCGYRYQKPGTYPVTATSIWAVTWQSSTGATGTIPFQVENTTTITMGEIQVLNR